jgi:hypothetical protein
MAAVLASGPGAVLSHRCSGALQGLIERWPPREIEMTTPRQARKRIGIRTFTAADLGDADRAVVDAIPCASIARTLIGIAAVQPELLEGAIAAAERRGAFDLAEVERLLGQGRAGSSALRGALRAHAVEFEWTRSRLEQRFFALCGRAGLPRPRVNAWISVPGWAGEVDFSWPDLALIVETDGWADHGDRAAFERDRRRDQFLVAVGWRIVRFTWRQIADEPERVVGTLRELVSAGRFGGGRRPPARSGAR